MTVADMVFRVSRSMGFDDTSGTDDLKQMHRWLNDSIVDILRRTHYRIDVASTTLTAGVSEYRLDTNVLAVDDGKGSTSLGIGHYVLVGLEEMIDLQETGSLGLVRPRIAIEGDLLVVSPTPTSNDTLYFYYVPRPTPMVSTANLGLTTDDAHDFSNTTYGGIPNEFVLAPEFYMLWRAAESDDKRSAAYGKGPAQGYLDNYKEQIKEMRKARWRRRGRSLLPARVGYPPIGTTRVRNDIYP